MPATWHSGDSAVSTLADLAQADQLDQCNPPQFQILRLILVHAVLSPLGAQAGVALASPTNYHPSMANTKAWVGVSSGDYLLVHALFEP